MNQAIIDRDERQAIETSEIMRNLPELPEDLEHWTLEVPMSFSRYIFYRKKKLSQDQLNLDIAFGNTGNYEGYCSYCKKYVNLEVTPKHNEDGHCPICGSKIIFKAWNIGRKKVIDKDSIMVFLKGQNQSVYARGFDVYRDYDCHPEEIKTEFDERVRYFFDGKRALRFLPKYSCNITWDANHWVTPRPYRVIGDWKMMQTCADYTGMNGFWYYPYDFENTVLQYSQFSKYANKTYAKPFTYLALYTKQPLLEMIMKIGGYRLTESLVNNESYSRMMVNLRAKSPKNIFYGLKPSFVKQMIDDGKDCKHVVYKRIMIEDKVKPSELAGISKAVLNHLHDNLNELLSIRRFGLRLPTIARYFHKQEAIFCKKEKRYSYSTAGEFFIEWLDYLSMAKKVGYDLKEKYYLMPKDLKKEHDKAAVRMKHKVDAELTAKMQKRAQQLEKYCFEFEGLKIIPCSSHQEIITEGTLLKNCVADYAERYANGKTCIFFIRKADDPEIPFFCLELNADTNTVRQCYGGKHNNIPWRSDKQVYKFVNQWLDFLKQPKKKVRKIA